MTDTETRKREWRAFLAGYGYGQDSMEGPGPSKAEAFKRWEKNRETPNPKTTIVAMETDSKGWALARITQVGANFDTVIVASGFLNQAAAEKRAREWNKERSAQKPEWEQLP